MGRINVTSKIFEGLSGLNYIHKAIEAALVHLCGLIFDADEEEFAGEEFPAEEFPGEEFPPARPHPFTRVCPCRLLVWLGQSIGMVHRTCSIPQHSVSYTATCGQRGVTLSG